MKDVAIRHLSFHDMRHVGYEITLDEVLEEDGATGDLEVLAHNPEVWKDGVKVEEYELSKLLYQMGLDTIKYGWYTTAKSKHKCLSCDNIVYDFRFAARERLDSKWIRSGNASDEAYLQSCKLAGVG